MTNSELLASVFGSEASALREACARWIAVSRLFRGFFEVNAAKIRKKARQAGSVESLRDLQLEMDTAYRLLADRRVDLIYERYLADKARGPDFTVTFKGHIVFNVEVRRLRAPIADTKLTEVVCEKLRQMPPSAVNVLLVGVDGEAHGLDLAASVKHLVHRAESRQDTFFSDRGYHDARDFLRALQRLSGALLCANWYGERPAAPLLWLNSQAKHPLPPEAQKLLRR